ncbi:MAG: phosphatase PAP2 family protein [Bacteroidetes bacterium]|nr:phosphatase PAP2 family protein [Bacteroidota bacterium]
MNALLQYLNELDTALLLAINGFHSPCRDTVMFWLSDRFIWIPLYLIIIYLLFRHFGKKTWVILIMAVLLVTLTDQVSVSLFKNIFHRLRPCHDPSLEGKIHLVRNICGGSYGFISSHAINTFAIAVFLFGFFRRNVPVMAWLLPVWAAAISYSRIYLGAHYPGDVLVGAGMGIFLGWVMRCLALRWLKRTGDKSNLSTRKHGR